MKEMSNTITKMKQVVSVSLGSSKRDKESVVDFLNTKISIKRIGTDGSLTKFREICESLDGVVDAIGIGGADLYVSQGEKKYKFSQVANLVKNVKKTPYVDGSGLKHTLERLTIKYLAEKNIINFKEKKTLLVSAADRYGMAHELSKQGGLVIYGDFIFGLGIPVPIREYSSVQLLGKLLLPIITKLPIQWFYPTGKKQDVRTPMFPKFFEECDIIAGDWHYIKKFAPDNLEGKTIITQTVRKDDISWLKSTKAKMLITTTPVVDGETFATNVMEATIVALLGKNADDITEKEYHNIIAELNWQPNLIDLTI